MDKPTNDGDRATVGRAAAIIGFERLREGHPEAARVALVQALPHLDGAPELRWKGRSYTNLGEALLALGRIEEGCTALRRGSRALRKAEVDDEAALVQARLGAVLHSQGDVEAGLTRLRAAMDRATKAGLKERGSLRTDLGLAEASARRFDVALELLRRSARDAKNIGLVREEAFAHFGLASVGSEAGGREDEVRESFWWSCRGSSGVAPKRPNWPSKRLRPSSIGRRPRPPPGRWTDASWGCCRRRSRAGPSTSASGKWPPPGGAPTRPPSDRRWR